MSINVVCISGNLTREPEVRSAHSGTSILSFGMAVNDRRKNNQTGEWEDKPNFVDVIVFGRRADSLSRILTKGMKVTVNGKLSYSSWERDGQKRSKLGVVAEDVDIMSQRNQNGRQGAEMAHTAPQQPQQGNYTNQSQYGPQNGYQQPHTGYQQQYQGYGDELYQEDQPF